MPETKPLYHFMRTENALQAIERHRLKFADLNKVNDPYESLSIGLDSYEEEKKFSLFLNSLAEMYGVVCFSCTHRDPSLWGHYADRCKGICLGFDVELDDDSTKNHIRPVTYIKYRMDISEVGLKFDNGSLVQTDQSKSVKLVHTKSWDWVYEEEWRIWERRGEPDPVTGLHFLPFGDHLKLREILVGFRCIEEYPEIKSRLDKLVASYPDPPDILFTDAHYPLLISRK